MNKKKGMQGLDGVNLEYAINLENAKHLYIPPKELKNDANNIIVKVDCVGGKIRAYINSVHAIRLNNVKPLSITEAVKLDIVKSTVIDFLQKYLQENLGNQYSNEYINNLRVTQVECNLTLQTYGKATPSAVLSLFDLAFDETGMRRQRRHKDRYEKINKSWMFYKPRTYKLKC